VSTVAIIPARGGSKGLPGKNIRTLAGLPLLEHSVRLAHLCPEVGRTIVSTDSPEIAEVALRAGAEVPFVRPPELALDETPMLPVLQHALAELDACDRVLLLDPTSPGRLPEDVARAHELLAKHPEADGVIAVSEPSSNPIWEAVVVRGAFVEPLFAEASSYGRRQDVPRVLRINGALYLFRSDFLRTADQSWLSGRHLPLEIPELRAFHIDTEQDFDLCELVLESGLVTLPWLSHGTR
jgi:N-acylneuraminate cytidylyltransferase